MKQSPDLLPRCQICQQEKPEEELVHARTVHGDLSAFIQQTNPAWDATGYICLDDLNQFRSAYVEQILSAEKGELSALEAEVAHSFATTNLIAEDTNETFDSQLSLGDRLADRLATFGGSWSFISIFTVILFLWMVINSGLLLTHPFDPYPFILLNLVLSCVAAIQAPVIMMSQNRQESHDRLQAEHDYQVNLKAELEIRQLHEKLDHLIAHQWERLSEIQQVQLDMLRDIQHIVQKNHAGADVPEHQRTPKSGHAE